MSEFRSNRREFVAGLMALASTASMGCKIPSQVEQAESDRFLKRMLIGIDLDDIIDGNWHLSDAVGPRAGAVILNMTHLDGRTVRIDVCRRGKAPLGPVATEHLDLIVMDGGGGRACYDDEMQLALLGLADALQQNDYPYQLSESLLTHSERLKAFPDVLSRAAHELIPTPINSETLL